MQWTDTGIASSYKFINKLYELVNKFKKYKRKKDSHIVENLKNISTSFRNIEDFQFNKSVAKIYEFVNISEKVYQKRKLLRLILSGL